MEPYVQSCALDMTKVIQSAKRALIVPAEGMELSMWSKDYILYNSDFNRERLNNNSRIKESMLHEYQIFNLSFLYRVCCSDPCPNSPLKLCFPEVSSDNTELN